MKKTPAKQPKPSKKPTIMDLSNAAGFSPMACSYAVNGKTGVSDATREHILATAKKIGYVPSLSSRALRNGKSGLVLVATPSLTHKNVETLVKNIQAADKTVLLHLSKDCTKALESATPHRPELAVVFAPFKGEYSFPVIAAAGDPMEMIGEIMKALR